jgi:hypothetical protein
MVDNGSIKTIHMPITLESPDSQLLQVVKVTDHETEFKFFDKNG